MPDFYILLGWEIAEIKGREVRLAISQDELARRVAIARREAGLSGSGCSRKTIQRMELGRVPTHCGYTKMVRYNEATCQAWLNEYIASECSRLRHELEHALVRRAHNNSHQALIDRTTMANAIAGQFFAFGVGVKGGSSLRFRYGSAN